MITFIGKQEATRNSGSPATSQSVSCATGTRTHGVLVVIVNVINGTDPFNVTWNGTALQKRVESGAPNHSSDIWYLLEPEGGTHDVEVSFGGSGSLIHQIIVAWYDSDVELDVGDIDTANFETDDLVFISLDTPDASALCVVGAVSADNNVPTQGSDTELKFWDQGGNVAGGMYKITSMAGTQIMGWDRNNAGLASPFNIAGAVFFEPTTNTSPTITPNTPDEPELELFPTLEFTGNDPDEDDLLTYEIQISNTPDFQSGSVLRDNFSGGGGLTIHPNPATSGTTWLGHIPVDDRTGISFTAFGGTLDKIRFRFGPHETVPATTDGSAIVRVYSHTGTYGSSSAPTNAAAPGDTPTPGWLAQSAPMSYSPGSYSVDWREFTFSDENRIPLAPGEHYVAILDWRPTDYQYNNTITVTGDSLNSGSLHPGNCYLDGFSEPNNGPQPDWDIHFGVCEYGTILSYSSAEDAGFENTEDSGAAPPFTPGEKIAFTLDVELEPGVVYYWRVRAKDQADAYSAWSTPRSFTVSDSGAVNANVISSPGSTQATGLSTDLSASATVDSAPGVARAEGQAATVTSSVSAQVESSPGSARTAGPAAVISGSAQVDSAPGAARAAGLAASAAGSALVESAPGWSMVSGQAAAIGGGATVTSVPGFARAAGQNVDLSASAQVVSSTGSARAAGSDAEISSAGNAQVESCPGWSLAIGAPAALTGSALVTTYAGLAIASGAPADGGGATLVETYAGSAWVGGAPVDISGAALVQALPGWAMAAGAPADAGSVVNVDTLPGTATAFGTAAMLSGTALASTDPGFALAWGGSSQALGLASEIVYRELTLRERVTSLSLPDRVMDLSLKDRVIELHLQDM